MSTMYALHTVLRSLCTVVTYLLSTIIDTSHAARYRTCSDVIFNVTLSSTLLVPHREHSLSQLQRPFTGRNKCTVASVILTTTGMLQQMFCKNPKYVVLRKQSQWGSRCSLRQTDRRVGEQIWFAPTWFRTPNRLARYLAKAPSYGLAHSESCYKYVRFQL